MVKSAVRNKLNILEAVNKVSTQSGHLCQDNTICQCFPTSDICRGGLDMVSATEMMTLLKQLARQGRTIICTVHQPTATVFKTLDLVYVMSGGECCYQGTQSQLVPFLASTGFECPTTYNPADYVMEIISTDNREELSGILAASQNGKQRFEPPQESTKSPGGTRITKLCRKETMAVMPKVFSADTGDHEVDIEYPTTFLDQTRILLKRRFIQQSRNKLTFAIMLLHHALSGLMIGSIFHSVGNNGSKPFENFKFLLSCVVFFMYTYVMSSALLFPFEVKRIRREYFNRWYGLKSYFVAHTISSLPQQVVFGGLFVAIVYPLSDQPMEVSRIISFYLTGLFIGLTSEGLGLTVGAIFKVTNGSMAGPMTFSPMLAVAVYGMGFGEVIEPVMQILMYTSYLRFGITGFSVSVYADRDDMDCPPEQATYCPFQNPAKLLASLGMKGCGMTIQLIALFCFLIFFRVTAYVALRHRLSYQMSAKIIPLLKKILRPKNV